MDDHRRDVNSGVIPADMAGVFQKSDKMVRALLESASQGIISVDQRGTIVLVNRRAEEMFGYERRELLGNQLEVLLPESKRDLHNSARAGYFTRPRIRHVGTGMELTARRKDGSEFPVEVGLSYVELDEGLFAIAFVSDISTRKNLEAQLMHSQRMEALGKLAGGVAHDFNNLLTVICGYNRMILDELSRHDPVRDYAEEILNATDRAGALTNQLLAFSRRQVMQLRVVNVNAIVQQAEKMLRRILGEDVELILGLKPDVGNIKADPGHLEQAIVNLAVNARDAMPLGGRLMIDTANVCLDETYTRTHVGVSPGEFVMIAVSDTGKGMDAETKERIFEPFFTTKPLGKGTGLGLAMVYGIAKQAGGDIWVYSEPERGTTFKLYFPRVAESPGEAILTPAAVVDGGHETILLVEDEQSVRALTVSMLKRLGYKVLQAANAAEAIEISDAHEGVIEMLLTDVVMPHMSGRELSDRLLLSRPGIKVLYVSGYTEDAVVHHGVLDSVTEFLPKPFSREVLARKIRDVLANL